MITFLISNFDFDFCKNVIIFGVEKIRYFISGEGSVQRVGNNKIAAEFNYYINFTLSET